MSDLKIYIRKNNSISNKTFNIKEKNINLENYLGNYIKNRPKMENSLKKNLSYSRLVDNSKILTKTKTTSNLNNINPKTNSFNFFSNKAKQNTNANTNTNNTKNSFIVNDIDNTLPNNIDNNVHCLTKHSSMKYIKISPIIKPLHNRIYFTPKSDTQANNNEVKNKNKKNNNNNINLDEVIKKTKIEDADEGASSTDRQSQIINNIENMPIHIMNNINIINNNLINKENKDNNDNKKINEEKKIVFIKKRIPSCGKKSHLKKSDNNVINKENENINKIQKNENNNINYNTKSYNKNKIKNKIINSIKNEEANSIYIKNNNNNFINYYSHKFHCNKINKNSFNKASYKQIKNKSKLNIEEIHKNIFTSIKSKYYSQKDYSTVNNNINNNINNNYQNNYEQTKIAFKELNLEDFLLIIQKFDDIRNNIKRLNNLNIMNKKILEKSHVNQIKLYDLFRFYMGSSFDGTPEKLFNSKRSKFYLHCYAIIFILSLGTLYIMLQNINITLDKLQDIVNLINIQEKIFLLFCDLIIQKLNKKYNDNIWVEQILDVLNNKMIFNINNHFIQIKTLTLESYDIINNLLISINNYGAKRNTIISKDQEKYLFNNFFQKNMEYISQIEINQLEEDFTQNIFKSINLKSKYVNIPTYQRSITTKNYKEFNPIINNNYNYKKSTNTSMNIYDNPSDFAKIKKHSFNNIFNDINLNINSQNYNTNSSTTKPNQNLNTSVNPNYSLSKTTHPKNSSIPTRQEKQPINQSNIQQYDIKIPDTDVITPPLTIPYLNFQTSKKFTLIMDLDETMVNFKFTNIQKGVGKLFIRPFLESFLEVIKDYYEIIAFTSATRDYADIVLDIIEKNKRKRFFDGRLYREHTTQFGKKYIKDLSKIGRDLSRIVIVDNLSQCFKLHNENGILICSFYGEDENDNALIELQKILIKIYYDDCDVRKSIYKYRDDIFNKISKSKMNYS